jgi:hypothetical protein
VSFLLPKLLYLLISPLFSIIDHKLTSCFERGLKLTFIGVHVNTENNQAAQVDPLDAFVQEAIDQDSEEIKVDTPPTESAPVEDAKEPEPTEAEKPTGDGFQKRINKVTADKYAEKKRADELQKKVDAYEASNEALKEPRLTDPEIDYDEVAFDKATTEYKIKQGVQDALAQQLSIAKAEQQKAEGEKVLGDYNDRVNALGKKDFVEKQNSIPELPDGVADAIMQSEDGAAMVYHLGSNPEQANALANMTPAMAIMELGKLSMQLTAKPEIKLSAAPDPIDPVKAGSSLNSNIDDDMSMDEWMKKYG